MSAIENRLNWFLSSPICWLFESICLRRKAGKSLPVAASVVELTWRRREQEVQFMFDRKNYWMMTWNLCRILCSMNRNIKFASNEDTRERFLQSSINYPAVPLSHKENQSAGGLSICYLFQWIMSMSFLIEDEEWTWLSDKNFIKTLPSFQFQSYRNIRTFRKIALVIMWIGTRL